MDAISGLQKMMREAEDPSKHDVYWYSVSEALIIMVCGMLCSLQTIDDIHEWSKAAPTQVFLKERFWIEKSRAGRSFTIYSLVWMRCIARRNPQKQ